MYGFFLKHQKECLKHSLVWSKVTIMIRLLLGYTDLKYYQLVLHVRSP